MRCTHPHPDIFTHTLRCVRWCCAFKTGADVVSLGVCVLEEGGDVVSLYSALTTGDKATFLQPQIPLPPQAHQAMYLLHT